MATPNEIPPAQLAELADKELVSITKRIVITFTVFSFVSVCLRIFTRLRYKSVGREDYFIVIAMVLSIMTGVFQVLQANAGNGKHAVFIPFPEGAERILKYLFWSIIGYNWGLTFIKISIILQYKRIFTVQGMKWPLNIAMAICVAWGIATFFTSVFTCVPVQAYWRVLEKPNAQCIKDEILWFTNAGINIFTDLMVAALPVRVVWSLQIPIRQKTALIGILTIGWFVCVVSFLRLNALVILSHHPDDRSYYTAPVAYWSSIELNLGIVCASLPALRPLIVKVIPGFSTRNGSRGYSTALSGYKSKGYGLGSKATRDTDKGDMELGMRSIKVNASPSMASQETTNMDNGIHVTQEVVQHFEKTSRSGHRSEIERDIDNESQRNLVTDTEFPIPVPRTKN